MPKLADEITCRLVVHGAKREDILRGQMHVAVRVVLEIWAARPFDLIAPVLRGRALFQFVDNLGPRLFACGIVRDSVCYRSQSQRDLNLRIDDNRIVRVEYASPPVGGRSGALFGEAGRISQYPNSPIWRAGAYNFGMNDPQNKGDSEKNKAESFYTEFHTDAELRFGEQQVPAGDYSLVVYRHTVKMGKTESEAWELALNHKYSYSSPDYDASQDLCRIPLAMGKPQTMVEDLRYSLSQPSPGRYKLELAWENVSGSVFFSAQ